MKLRTCAADDCNEQFEPTDWRQIYHSSRCANRMRARKFKRRKRGQGPHGGGGPGKRQPMLFPKNALAGAKPPAAARAKSTQNDLFQRA